MGWPSVTLAVWVVSAALVAVPNVAVMLVLEKVPLETAALRTVTAPELAFTPPVVAVHRKFRSAPVRGATKVASVAVVLVKAVVPGPGGSEYIDDVAVAVPVTTPVRRSAGDDTPL